MDKESVTDCTLYLAIEREKKICEHVPEKKTTISLSGHRQEKGRRGRLKMVLSYNDTSQSNRSLETCAYGLVNVCKYRHKNDSCVCSLTMNTHEAETMADLNWW